MAVKVENLPKNLYLIEFKELFGGEEFVSSAWLAPNRSHGFINFINQSEEDVEWALEMPIQVRGKTLQVRRFNQSAYQTADNEANSERMGEFFLGVLTSPPPLAEKNCFFFYFKSRGVQILF